MGFTWISSILTAIFIWISCSSLGGLLVLLWGLLARVFVNVEVIFSRAPYQILIRVLFLSSLWAMGELILTQTPFFWIGISDSIVSGDLYLAGLARWIGAGGLCVVQLLVGFWILLLFNNWKNKEIFIKCLTYGLLINVVLHIVGFLLIIPNLQEPYKFPVAIWQTNIPTREKVFVNNKELSERIISLQKQALSKNAKLFILPEGSLRSNFKFKEGNEMPTLAGGFRVVADKLRNSLLAFKKGDKVYSESLDKFRLVTLGENVPNFFSNLFKGIAAFGSLEPGSRSRLFEWANSPKLAVAICYEISDGRGIKEAVKNGSELILTLANLDPYPRRIHAQFLSLARMRSLENNRENLIVSNTGPTGLISGDGRMIELFDPNIEKFDVLYPTLQKNKTFFSKYGNLPLVIMFLFLFIINGFYLFRELIKPPPKTTSSL